MGRPFDGAHNVCDNCGGPIWNNPLWEPIGWAHDALGAHQMRYCPDCIHLHPLGQAADQDDHQQVDAPGEVVW